MEPAPMDTVEIRDATIRLGQLLKLANLADDGAHAKILIESGDVLVDGEVERRRGAQISPGAVVRVGDAQVQVTTRA